MTCFRLGDGVPAERPKAVVYLYVCPWCQGTGRWTNGEHCWACSGACRTNSPEPGIDNTVEHPEAIAVPEVDPVPLPRPPGVMRRPCVDCAYRPGSPEEEGRPGPEQPFWCHHGMLRRDTERGTDYLPAAEINGMPLGALLCAGWWALATGQPLPDEAFRDPGGSDRTEDTPTNGAGQ